MLFPWLRLPNSMILELKISITGSPSIEHASSVRGLATANACHAPETAVEKHSCRQLLLGETFPLMRHTQNPTHSSRYLYPCPSPRPFQLTPSTGIRPSQPALPHPQRDRIVLHNWQHGFLRRPPIPARPHRETPGRPRLLSHPRHPQSPHLQRG